jgi:cyclopropane fatty-acyl-phospholipid synthase-like methyltransferase
MPLTEKSLDEHYSEEFYDDQIGGSLRSARKFAAHLVQIWQPTSVVDVGCGRGPWLKAFLEGGAAKVHGIDGPWNSADKMIDPAIAFTPVDLRQLSLGKSGDRYDLAISLEVAEHLEAEYADSFVEGLTRLSDVIMFGAAFVEQGGTNHVNEQPHTFWQKLFAQQGYVVYDVFRERFWKDSDVEFWYSQNTFLYVREKSLAESTIQHHGCKRMYNFDFMDAVHPTLYELKLRQVQKLRAQLAYETQPRQALKRLLPSFLVAAIKRLRPTA